MDRTVPLAAARILDFIRDTEVGTDGPFGYHVSYGHNEDKLPKPVTQMTVDEILGAQASWSKRFGSSATAGYQFMRTTLTTLPIGVELGNKEQMKELILAVKSVADAINDKKQHEMDDKLDELLEKMSHLPDQRR